jgi:hypothetical protein
MLVLMASSKAMAQNNTIAQGQLFIHELRPAADADAAFPETEGVQVGKEGRPGQAQHMPFRSFDGRKNNLSSIGRNKWGGAGIALFREIPAAYGAGDVRNAMAGANRPSARKISNVLLSEPVTIFNTRELNTLVYQWGQLLDHDMTLTPTAETEYVAIPLPKDEKLFTRDIPFYRSEVRAGTGMNDKVRQQINLNTAWIDGSVVYGSDATRARWLRTLQDGKMKTSKGNLLPFNTKTGERSGDIDPQAPMMKNDGHGTVRTFVAGDVRAAENPVLTSLHTVLVREHNRICDRLLAQGLKNDEEIYQQARKEVGALIQVITYEEYLPALGVKLRPYTDYKNDIRPDIMNSFATAGYRLGHTMVSDDVVLVNNKCSEIGPGKMELVEVFWNPGLVSEYGIDIFLKGATAHTQYQTDTKINDILRNMLFGDANDPERFGIDLGSVNIQRGRDHGLPDYNTVRQFYRGSTARDFSNITANDTLAEELEKLYEDVNDIDLWVGILAEDHLPNTSVGKTLHEMLRVQFENLRIGDYYYYQHDPWLPAKVRDQVSKTRLVDVLKRNTSLTSLPDPVFFTKQCPGMEEEVKTATARLAGPEPGVLPAGIIIYPNPATDMVQVSLGNTAGGSAVIEIYSTAGRLLETRVSALNEQSLQVPIGHLANGLFHMIIRTGNESKSFRLVKLPD